MLDQARIREVVQRNCDISDARYARQHTMCVYLLKMREYYRWEKGLSEDEPLPMGQVGEWVTARERLWDDLEVRDFDCLPMGEEECLDPFASADINQVLAPLGLIYSAGYGRFVKPHFFLARLHRRDHEAGFEVLVSDEELARDLSAPPAMFLNQTVYVRRDAMRRLIWERIEEWQWQKSPDGPLARALAIHGYHGDRDRALECMTEAEVDTAVWHELGEGLVGRELGEAWEHMVLDLAGSRAELHLRAVRDMWADAMVTLPRLLADGRDASLHFYFANLKGLRRALVPGWFAAYGEWSDGGDAEGLRDCVERGHAHWSRVCTEILGKYREQGTGAADAIADTVESAFV